MKIGRASLAKVMILVFLLQGAFCNGTRLLTRDSVKAAENEIVYQTPSLQFTIGGTGEVSTKQTDMRSIINCKVESYLEYDVDVPKAGSYNVMVQVKKYKDRGIFQLSIDGVNQGEPQDLYSPQTEDKVMLDLGNKVFDKEGIKKFRFIVTGKNDASAVYTLSFYGIKLVPGTASDTPSTPVATPAKAPEQQAIPYSKENFHLYLFIGQSNMASRAPIGSNDKGTVDRTYLLNQKNQWEPAKFDVLQGSSNKQVQGYNRYSTVEVADKANGFSSGYSFAQAITEKNPQIGVGLIVNAVGGTALKQWQKGAGTKYFEEAVRRTKEAMKTGTLKGIIWHQGESDNSNDNYLPELKTFVEDLRKELGMDAQSLPFVASELLPIDKYAKFNNRIPQLGNFVPSSDYISSQGAKDIGDSTHFNTEGQKLLGARYAEKILKMVYQNDTKVEVPVSNVPATDDNSAEDAADYKVRLNGQIMELDVPPAMIGDRIFVPLRAIFEALGAQVEWEESTQTITGIKGNTTVILQVGSENATINGKPSNLDVAPTVIENRTLVPVRFIAESLGATVSWDEKSKTAIVDTAGESNTKAENISISNAQKYIQDIGIPADFKPTGITKNYYLDVIEKAVDAYSKQDLEERTVKFGTAMVDDIQAYSRLTSAIAVLLANGRKTEYRELWEKMMDACCRDAGRITTGNMPDFAVKELMLSYKAMSNNISPEKKEQWLSDLKKVDPYKNYQKVYTKTKDLNNINVYNMAGEYLRQTEGLTDTTDYFDKHWPLQFKNFDSNGMYIDPGAPVLYDLTTRAQMQLILGNGYIGKYKEQLDGYMKNAGLLSLFMQSSDYQMAYGGRSNQYQFNEALIAATCEYEAARYKQLGDMKTAGVFKRSAHLAAQSIERWLNENPPRHIKNFFPVDSKYGTEGYGYYDKYMVTLGNFIYIAYMFADDSIQEVPCPAEVGGYVFKTSDTFHKVFANSNGHSIEIDTKADPHYDSTGLGRYHKSGIPSELALSVPFTAKPEYSLAAGVLTGNIAISPGWDNGSAGKQFLSELSSGLNSSVKVLAQNAEQVSFSIEYTGTAFKGCKGVRETYTLNKEGVQIQSELIDPAVNKIYYQVPLLVTNGRDVTEITQVENQTDVKMAENHYIVQTDGTLTIDKNKYGNRNGEYNMARMEKNDKVVTIDLKLY